MGIAFLGDGFLPLGMLAVLLGVLPLAAPFWRTRRYARERGNRARLRRAAHRLWLAALAHANPPALHPWLAARDRFRMGAIFDRDDPLEVFYFVRILPWYAWPAWPLAAWSLWRARHRAAPRAASCSCRSSRSWRSSS